MTHSHHDKDTPEWQSVQKRLAPAAGAMIEQLRSSGTIPPSVYDKFLLEAANYLESHGANIEGLLADLPKANEQTAFALNACFWRYHSAAVIYYLNKYSTKTVLSAEQMREYLDKYIASIDCIASLHSTLTTTSIMASVHDQTIERGTRAAEIRQILLVDLLKSILPTEHFQAVESLGIDADKWSQAEPPRYIEKLRNHAEKTRFARDGLASAFMSGPRKARPDTDILVSDLADIWEAGTGKRASASRNSAIEASAPFYRFFVKAWKMLCEDIKTPAPDTVRRSLERKRSAKKSNSLR